MHTPSRRALTARRSFAVSPSARTVRMLARVARMRTWPSRTSGTWLGAYAFASTAATCARRPPGSRAVKPQLIWPLFAPWSKHVRWPAGCAGTNASVTRHTTSTAVSALSPAAGARMPAALCSRQWADLGRVTGRSGYIWWASAHVGERPPIDDFGLQRVGGRSSRPSSAWPGRTA
jgi:hypothetical protein